MCAILFLVIAQFHNLDPSGLVPCGAEALAMCFSNLGDSFSAEEIAKRLPRGGKDASLMELKSLASSMGYNCQGIRWEDDPPSECPPAVVPVTLPDGQAHFVAILKWSQNEVLVGEGRKQKWTTLRMLRSAHWDGTALHVSRSVIDRKTQLQLNIFAPILAASMLISVFVYRWRGDGISQSTVRV